mmetsp:Transcript_4882/g.11346  ORF Transcript_4882/g.11346 Transcript_4882/m.11346 type:complete len:221 (+) Transcript_4882:993-1655(+)
MSSWICRRPRVSRTSLTFAVQTGWTSWLWGPNSRSSTASSTHSTPQASRCSALPRLQLCWRAPKPSARTSWPNTASPPPNSKASRVWVSSTPPSSTSTRAHSTWSSRRQVWPPARVWWCPRQRRRPSPLSRSVSRAGCSARPAMRSSSRRSSRGRRSACSASLMGTPCCPCCPHKTTRGRMTTTRVPTQAAWVRSARRRLCVRTCSRRSPTRCCSPPSTA